MFAFWNPPEGETQRKAIPMIPWIYGRLTDGTGEMHLHEISSPMSGLTALLWDIERPQRIKDQLVLVDAPQSVVWQPYGDATYLFRRSRRVGFASFALNHGAISTVGLRYRDPMDPNSGTRNKRILSGWQGVAELTAAAVRRSRLWKDLETIEFTTENGNMYYELWAKPRHDHREIWSHVEGYFARGACVFRRNVPVRLATVSIDRRWEDDHLVEEVTNIMLFPDYYGTQHWSGKGVYRNDRWQQYVTDSELAQAAGSAVDAPMVLDLSQKRLMSFTPHDDLQLNITWES